MEEEAKHTAENQSTQSEGGPVPTAPRKRRRMRILILVGFLLPVLLVGLLSFLPGLKLKDDGFLYVPRGSTYQSVQDSLSAMEALRFPWLFRLISTASGYSGDAAIRPGRYAINPAMSTFQLVRNLKGGRQTPVKLQFTSRRTKPKLAQYVTAPLEMDAGALLKLMNDPAVAEVYGLDTANIQLLFLPNTYEVYWTISPRELLKKMKASYDAFWEGSRDRKAQQLGLTRREVGVLASIVHAETYQNSEKPRVAGVYLNRLKKDMRLQADPTVIWAIGDFSIKRVLHRHLRYDSPYNTYRVEGLPPGPINNPSPASIDAVLNAEEHEYLYFSARADGSGYHNFSRTLLEHERKADEYRALFSQAP